MRIGNIVLENPVILAPMAGVTDRPFRLICKKMGCGWAVTEMISAKALLYENVHTWEMLKTDVTEYPLAVQLFGREPDGMAEAAGRLESLGFTAIDINMGCPAPKIVKNGEGSALLKEPDLAARIVERIARAVTIPVTVKIRSGFDKDHIIAPKLAKDLEACGAAAVAVHGRTREQYYSGRADWEVIRRVKTAVCIPVIGNGDVTSPAAAEKMMRETGCDGIMIGRAAQGNPWIFQQVIHYLHTGETPDEICREEVIRTALSHCRMMFEEKGRIGLLEMRKHLCWYTKGMPGASRLREQINRAESLPEIEELLCQP